jgi:hypothetical protein
MVDVQVSWALCSGSVPYIDLALEKEWRLVREEVGRRDARRAQLEDLGFKVYAPQTPQIAEGLRVDGTGQVLDRCRRRKEQR